MARNNQLMYWEGSIDSFKQFMTRHCRNKRINAVYIIYKTGDPDIWVWTKRKLSAKVVSSLRLRLHDAIRITGTLEVVK